MRNLNYDLSRPLNTSHRNSDIQNLRLRADPTSQSNLQSPFGGVNPASSVFARHSLTMMGASPRSQDDGDYLTVEERLN